MGQSKSPVASICYVPYCSVPSQSIVGKSLAVIKHSSEILPNVPETRSKKCAFDPTAGLRHGKDQVIDPIKTGSIRFGGDDIAAAMTKGALVLDHLVCFGAQRFAAVVQRLRQSGVRQCL